MKEIFKTESGALLNRHCIQDVYYYTVESDKSKSNVQLCAELPSGKRVDIFKSEKEKFFTWYLGEPYSAEEDKKMQEHLTVLGYVD